MAKIDWRRARKFEGKELKYEEGTELSRSGQVVRHTPRDTLEKRARREERKWAKQQAKKKGLPEKPYNPTPFDLKRDPTLGVKWGKKAPVKVEGRDVVMDVLDETS